MFILLQPQNLNLLLINLFYLPTMQAPKKKSLCRYYLRGLCIYDAGDCRFSHGINDLDYHLWQPEEMIQYNYLKETDFSQNKTKKGPKVYKDLFEFQTEKIFLLEELNEDRKKRVLIRNALHRKLFQDFIKLLHQTFPQAKFTQEFLIRQYTRVGFNKLMTRIKFSHLTTQLCSDDNSEYFQFVTVMPPHVKQQRSFIIKKAPTEEIDAFYKSSYENIIKQHIEQTIDQGKVKKMLFNFTRPSIHIPPLNVHLKNKKVAFPIYLRSILGENIVELQIKFEADLPTLVESSKRYLEKQLQSNFVQWNDVYKYLSKEHQINNGNTINQIKPFLALEGYRFLFFPMTQFIVHPQIYSKLTLPQHDQCPCNFKRLYQRQQLSILNEIIQNEYLYQLQHKESYDVYDLESLMQCASSIYNSKVLGVDLQGKLRKNGYIEMIQLNNGNNTFLIDIYRMDLNGDVQAFQLTKKLLRNVLANENILKIFHDCRHDSLALHQFMQCCIRNVYDTSASQTYKGQIQLYSKLDEFALEQLDLTEKNHEKRRKQHELKAKEVITQANNVKTPGLNEVLKAYNAPHGINKNKQLFHSMWNKGQTTLFDQRPLDPDFREYCIKDVLDLPHVYQQMSKQAQKTEFNLQIAKWLSSQYVKYGYLATEDSEKK